MSAPSLHEYGKRKTDHETRSAIADKYRDGWSLAAIGREYRLSYVTVRQVLIDARVELRPDPKRGRPFGACGQRVSDG